MQEPIKAFEADLAGSTFTKCKLAGTVFEDINLVGRAVP